MSRDHLDAIRGIDPAADRTPAQESSARMDHALARLLTDAPPQTARPRWHARAVAIGAAVVCSVGVATIVAVSPTGTTSVPGLPTASAADLLTAAEVAARDEPGDGRWRYMRVQDFTNHMMPGRDGRIVTTVVPSVTETWVGPDDEMRERTVQGAPTSPLPFGRRPPAMPDDGRVVLLPANGASGFTPGEIRRLPTDPGALARRLARRPLIAGADPVSQVALLLRSPLTPPAVSGALLAVLRRLPGAELRHAVQDPARRTGDGVVFRSGDSTTLFLFDRDSGLLLGTRSSSSSEIPGRTVTDWELILARDRRDRAPSAELRQPPPITRGTITTVPPAVPIG